MFLPQFFFPSSSFLQFTGGLKACQKVIKLSLHLCQVGTVCIRCHGTNNLHMKLMSADMRMQDFIQKVEYASLTLGHCVWCVCHAHWVGFGLPSALGGIVMPTLLPNNIISASFLLVEKVYIQSKSQRCIVSLF